MGSKKIFFEKYYFFDHYLAESFGCSKKSFRSFENDPAEVLNSKFEDLRFGGAGFAFRWSIDIYIISGQMTFWKSM